MGLDKDLEALLRREKNTERRLLKESRMLPAGDLIIKKNGSYLFPYQKNGTVERAITKDRKLSSLLARKCFIKRQIMTCRQNCKVLKNALKLVSAAGKSAQNSTYRRLEAVFPEKNYKYSTLQLNWISSYYEKNPFRPENLKYRTKSGILVRSKSERIIADLLTKYGFLFRYEQKLVIGDNVYYPDFIIMLDDGRMVIWEHFGLMDNEEYYLKACEKIENYRKAGFATHTNLICTYEDDIRSEEILEGIICRYLK